MEEPAAPSSSGEPVDAAGGPAPEVIPEAPGRAEIVPRRRLICPYLGLREDRTVVAIMPTGAHACYAQKRPFTPTVEHQAHLCLGGRYPICRFYPDPMAVRAGQYDPYQDSNTGGRVRWGMWAALAVVLLLLAGLVGAYVGGWAPFTIVIQLPPEQGGTPVAAAAPPVALVTDTPTPSPTPEPDTPTPVPVAAAPVAQDTPASSGAAVAGAPAADASGQVLTLSPRQVDVGWWASSQGQRGTIGDSFLYAGVAENEAYVSAIRFDLRRVARGTEILDATLRMTGLRAPALDPESGASWVVQLIPESALPQLPGASFFDVFGVPAAMDLAPVVTAGDVSVGAANTWVVDGTARNWIEQQLLDGASAIIVRIAPLGVNGDNLFAWDSGQGSETRAAPPQLSLSLGPPPPTPPPTPTPQVMIATLTPEPANVLTVVAMTLMPEGQPTATPTPLAIEVITPTPFPENLATVQAAALAEGRPEVLLNTPVPANGATATADAVYATAVALTTGTFTPVPTEYVTPVLYYPSPPPENVATAAARAVTATAVAALGTPTPTLPWNAVSAIYTFATPTPGNQETAVAQVQVANAQAATTGTPTATPWNLVVITQVPQPTPQPTPIPLIVDAGSLTPTPTPTPTRVLVADDFKHLRGQILFLSNRTGSVQTWSMDPVTGEALALITDERIHALAREWTLAGSPDGKERAFVVLVGLDDQEDNYQIRIENVEYGRTRDLTHFPRAANYDPAWSPTGRWIAFVSTLAGGDDIYLIRPNGEDLTRLTFNTWEWDKHPTWSPDGSQIAFFSNRETGRRQIWIMNADGGEQRNLSRNEFEDWDPVWVR